MDFVNDPIIKLVATIVICCACYWLIYLLLKSMISLISSLVIAKWLAHGLAATLAFGGLLGMFVTPLYPPSQQHLVWWMFVGMLIAMNLIITPFYYWFDKRASQQHGKARIPETVLHTLGFLGGGISAFISQRVFRHKTQKQAFKLITPAGILSTLLMLYLLIHFSPVWH